MRSIYKNLLEAFIIVLLCAVLIFIIGLAMKPIPVDIEEILGIIPSELSTDSTLVISDSSVIEFSTEGN